ncbi:MAG: FAD:protein FMN transferase [Alistipes sp.]|nr:FAD:protein FMN transferase [Candidatus Alistipes equi]
MKIRSLIFVLFCFTACARSEKYVVVDGAMLGTTYHIIAKTALPVDSIRRSVSSIDKKMKASMSIFDDSSLLASINRNEKDCLDEHLLYNISQARRYYELSQGKYDITIKPLTDLYGFSGKDSFSASVDSILEFVGMNHIRIDGKHILKDDPRVQIDLNSIAKGYTVDVIANMLEEWQVENYIVEVGGEIRLKGLNSKSKSWSIAVDTPYEGNETPGQSRQCTLFLKSGSVATSGNYRRFKVDASGNKIVHTLNPKSGKSVCSSLLSATVLAPRCADADAMATMFMAMGADDAHLLAERMRDSVKVYFIISSKTSDREFEIYSTLDNETYTDSL